ncbi:MAG TPA: orotidine-5'-phosphate decarboxylase [Chitinophagaceae bacterium]|nr:orotidine-5'-phosphate decarboxylase [Chitinophagaceae bacterium]
MNRLQLIEQIQQKKSYLCIGLDTDITKIPKHLQSRNDAVIAFNKAIISATKDHCVAYKINTAFYESMGLKGWEIMEETLHYIPKTHFTIADAKRGDIGNTSAQYAKTFFETLPFDAVTVAPYMGEDSVRPFLEYENKVTIVLGLTSNAGANDFQKLVVKHHEDESGLVPHLIDPNREKHLYQAVIEKVAEWGTPDNLMFVVGATRASDLADIRNMVPHNFLLVPGVGAQGGSLKEVSESGLNKDCGLLVNASRAVIFASAGEDFAEAATKAAKQYAGEMAGYLWDEFRSEYQ